MSTFFTGIFFFLALNYIQQYSIISLNISTSLHLILAFLFADFCYFISHYFSHKYRILWAIHGVHHSSHEFNLFTAFRLNWLSPIIDLFFYFWPIFIFGIDASALIAMRIIILVLQFWIHNDKIPKLGYFDIIFNSPANHIIHHSVSIEHRDKNFGGVFMIWDHLFGTYLGPNSTQKPGHFGVCTPVNSYNPIKIYFHEFIVWYKELKAQ